MNQKFFLSFTIFLLLIVAACSTSNNASEQKPNQEETEEVSEEISAPTPQLMEPDENTVCIYCNMKVYEKGTEMGVFSAQAITADGTNLFFDDIGCMLNQERVDNTTYDKYVRDYYTEEWVKLEEAHIVKAEIKTPMNYGYAFFATEEGSSKFIEELGEDKAKKATLDEIDEEASHRHIKKMENGPGMGGHHDDHHHEHPDENTTDHHHGDNDEQHKE